MVLAILITSCTQYKEDRIYMSKWRSAIDQQQELLGKSKSNRDTLDPTVSLLFIQQYLALNRIPLLTHADLIPMKLQKFGWKAATPTVKMAKSITSISCGYKWFLRIHNCTVVRYCNKYTLALAREIYIVLWWWYCECLSSMSCSTSTSDNHGCIEICKTFYSRANYFENW